MDSKKTNIGQTGLESIRLNNQKISELPLGTGNEAKDGLSEFIKTEKETKKNNVRAKYPKHSLQYLEARARECEKNIKRMKQYKKELKDKIAEYRQAIKDCRRREAELAKLMQDNPEDKEKIKELNRRYPPYNIEALEQQIEQFEDGIQKCDDTIEKELGSSADIREVLTLVNQREKELRNI